MDYKTKTAKIFRDRLKAALQKNSITAAELCRRSNTKQATFTQLINADEPRLPRSDTIAALATSLGVSTDWLLGLTHHPESGSGIVGRYVEIGKNKRSEESLDQWVDWYDEAAGKKVRHIPDWLPFYFYTEELLEIELEGRKFTPKMREKLRVFSLGNKNIKAQKFDFEVCTLMQELEMFAEGGYYWKNLDKKVRKNQLEHLIHIAGLYPKIRWYLFDGTKTYCTPFTVFGSERASYSMGTTHFVFHTDEHIKLLTETFDDIVKDAAVQAHETQSFIEGLLKKNF